MDELINDMAKVSNIKREIEYEMSMQLKISEEMFNELRNKFKEERIQIISYNENKRIYDYNHQIKIILKTINIILHKNDFFYPFTISHNEEITIFDEKDFRIGDIKNIKFRYIILEEHNNNFNIRFALEHHIDIYGSSFYITSELETPIQIINNLNIFLEQYAPMYLDLIYHFTKSFYSELMETLFEPIAPAELIKIPARSFLPLSDIKLYKNSRKLIVSKYDGIKYKFICNNGFCKHNNITYTKDVILAIDHNFNKYEVSSLEFLKRYPNIAFQAEGMLYVKNKNDFPNMIFNDIIGGFINNKFFFFIAYEAITFIKILPFINPIEKNFDIKNMVYAKNKLNYNEEKIKSNDNNEFVILKTMTIDKKFLYKFRLAKQVEEQNIDNAFDLTDGQILFIDNYMFKLKKPTLDISIIKYKDKSRIIFEQELSSFDLSNLLSLNPGIYEVEARDNKLIVLKNRTDIVLGCTEKDIKKFKEQLKFFEENKDILEFIKNN